MGRTSTSLLHQRRYLQTRVRFLACLQSFSPAELLVKMQGAIRFTYRVIYQLPVVCRLLSRQLQPKQLGPFERLVGQRLPASHSPRSLHVFVTDERAIGERWLELQFAYERQRRFLHSTSTILMQFCSAHLDWTVSFEILTTSPKRVQSRRYFWHSSSTAACTRLPANYFVAGESCP